MCFCSLKLQPQELNPESTCAISHFLICDLVGALRTDSNSELRSAYWSTFFLEQHIAYILALVSEVYVGKNVKKTKNVGRYNSIHNLN